MLEFFHMSHYLQLDYCNLLPDSLRLVVHYLFYLLSYWECHYLNQERASTCVRKLDICSSVHTNSDYGTHST